MSNKLKVGDVVERVFRAWGDMKVGDCSQIIEFVEPNLVLLKDYDKIHDTNNLKLVKTSFDPTIDPWYIETPTTAHRIAAGNFMSQFGMKVTMAMSADYKYISNVYGSLGEGGSIIYSSDEIPSKNAQKIEITYTTIIKVSNAAFPNNYKRKRISDIEAAIESLKKELKELS